MKLTPVQKAQIYAGFAFEKNSGEEVAMTEEDVLQILKFLRQADSFYRQASND